MTNPQNDNPKNKQKIAELLHEKAQEGPVEVSPDMADYMGAFEETAMTQEEVDKEFADPSDIDGDGGGGEA